jgi:hypothetical protein
MTVVKFKKACNDCPFRRDSTPGWTGGNPPEWFVESAQADRASYGPGDEGSGLAPCHETVDYDNPAWVEEELPTAAACAGSLIFAKNIAKIPRDATRAEAVRMVEADRETVFAYPQEFIDHHRNDPMSIRSWERGGTVNADELHR